MNWRIIITLSLFLFIGKAYGKEKSLGIRTGYAGTYFSRDGDKIGSTNSSYFVHLYKDSKILPFLFLQSGLEYTQVGGKLNNSSNKINYLGVPVALKAKIGPIYAFGGAAFNVKLSDKSTLNDMKWYDTNAFVGLGAEILFLTLDVKYYDGFTSVSNGMKNNGYQIGVGFRF